MNFAGANLWAMGSRDRIDRLIGLPIGRMPGVLYGFFCLIGHEKAGYIEHMDRAACGFVRHRDPDNPTDWGIALAHAG